MERDDAGRLPGLGDTVVRRFDAPEALDMRFHEVRTKSALNRVPGAARLPFEWTVNPYRGCSHACVYCLAGDTEVLLADGRALPIAELSAGDEILGTRGERYVPSRVLDAWETRKPAYRVVLADGTELVASAEHRFLSTSGWRHVVELTPEDELLGTGGFSAPPFEDAEYRRGYLCGLIRGDGHVATRTHAGPLGVQWQEHLFRLALADREALHRARAYLAEAGISTEEFPFRPAAGREAEIRGIRTHSRPDVDRIRDLLAWPSDASAQWCRGFLAGVYDADGEMRVEAAERTPTPPAGPAAPLHAPAALAAPPRPAPAPVVTLRLSSPEPAIVARAAACLRRLGFAFAVDSDGVRLGGASAERLRFLQSVDPAIARKRSLAGHPVETLARVVEVEPLGVELPMYDISTATEDFVAAGVVSHNCFARPTHEYLDLGAGRDFEREIIVKVNVPEVLRAELARPSWTKERVALGTNTDPYQWVEGRYRLMRGIWEAMRDFANPCSILTKSPLLLRDLDLMTEIAKVTQITACLSIPTLDEQAWRATEPHTPHPRARLEAVRELNRRGIPTGILIAPLMPGINDAPEQVERIVAAASGANATYISGNTLFLRGSTRDVFLEWLREARPDLVERYERLYAKGAYLSPPERRRIEVGAGAPWATRSYPDRFRDRGAVPPPAPPRLPRAARQVQESLF